LNKTLIYLYIIHLLKSSTCFEHYSAHLQEVYVVTVYMQPLVSSLSAGDCLVHRLRKSSFLTPCRRATQKCVITVPCVVDGSRISAFFYATSCTCVSHLVWSTYRFKVIASLMQDAWVSSYKQTGRY
jgi:hypothetical protein